MKFKRLRGRLVGTRLIPYFTREEIVTSADGFRGNAIAWGEDPVELFYLQSEGSGRVLLPTGSRYASAMPDRMAILSGRSPGYS